MMYWKEYAESLGFECSLEERKVWVGPIEFHIDLEGNYTMEYDGVYVKCDVRSGYPHFLKAYSEKSKKREVYDLECLELLKVFFGEGDETEYWGAVVEVLIKSFVGDRYESYHDSDGDWVFYKIDNYGGSIILSDYEGDGKLRFKGDIKRTLECGDDLSDVIYRVKWHIKSCIDHLAHCHAVGFDSISSMHSFLRDFRNRYRVKFSEWFEEHSKVVSLGDFGNKWTLMYIRVGVGNRIKFLVEPEDGLGIKSNNVTADGWISRVRTNDGYEYYTLMEVGRGNSSYKMQYVVDVCELREIENILW